MTNNPRLDDQGLPEHGSTWANGVVVRGTSRGPGQEIEVTSPRAGQPLRVISGHGTIQERQGRLFLTPTNTPAGEDIALVIDFG